MSNLELFGLSGRKLTVVLCVLVSVFGWGVVNYATADLNKVDCDAMNSSLGFFDMSREIGYPWTFATSEVDIAGFCDALAEPDANYEPFAIHAGGLAADIGVWLFSTVFLYQLVLAAEARSTASKKVSKKPVKGRRRGKA